VKARFRNAADADVGDAHGWYRERGLDLADQFLQAVDQCVESIERNPQAYPKVHGEIRRALLHRFPYCLFYVIDPAEIVVLGCLHGHRDPKVWLGRLDA